MVLKMSLLFNKYFVIACIIFCTIVVIKFTRDNRSQESIELDSESKVIQLPESEIQRLQRNNDSLLGVSPVAAKNIALSNADQKIKAKQGELNLLIKDYNENMSDVKRRDEIRQKIKSDLEEYNKLVLAVALDEIKSTGNKE